MNKASLRNPTDRWNGKIYSDGWRDGGLESADVTDKASGEVREVNVVAREIAARSSTSARPPTSSASSPTRCRPIRSDPRHSSCQ